MASKRWNRWTTGWSWRRTAACCSASWLAAASLAAVSAGALTQTPAPPPVLLSIECDPESGAGHTADADVVFAGVAEASFQDRTRPAPWIPSLIAQRWPPGLPMPTIESGPGVPAVRFRAEVGYKGAPAPEVVVHLLGTGPRISAGQEWTIFANRDADLELFTTECSGDQRGRLADPAADGLVPHPVAAADWRAALLAPLGVLAAIAAAGGGLALAIGRRRRPR